MSATTSSSKWSMSNLARSGRNVIAVQLSPGLHALTSGADLRLMLSANVCLKRRWRAPSAVSTTNSVEKMLASFAP